MYAVMVQGAAINLFAYYAVTYSSLLNA